VYPHNAWPLNTTVRSTDTVNADIRNAANSSGGNTGSDSRGPIVGTWPIAAKAVTASMKNCNALCEASAI
jgi:hypothetical protein